MTESTIRKATFAGGCFWCMVKPFIEWPGIEGILSGYMGGTVENPTYEQVKTGTTGHTEVVEITYDSSKFSYEQLLELYWQQVDPTDDEGQFQDRGTNYRAVIFYHDEEQRQLAEASKVALEATGRFKKPVITPVLPAETFYIAEEYHQDYYKKNPKGYKEDRENSGRDEFLNNHWN